MPSDGYTEARHLMVKQQIIARGIRDAVVLQAMLTVPREAFVGSEYVHEAYEDRPLPIGAGQTISQPYIVACMTEALRLSASDRVLEIGTGSGYAAAVLSCIVKQVYSVERIKSLVCSARRRLQSLGYTNVEVRYADGTLGWPEQAPFDAIVATAGGPGVPQALKAQLATGGRLVMPVGADSSFQQLIRLTRTRDNAFLQEDLGGVAFVPLIGAQGWKEMGEREGQREGRQPTL
jgi:protein-L-isoaspartate(D-aspartate) O-methyltransferase